MTMFIFDHGESGRMASERHRAEFLAPKTRAAEARIEAWLCTRMKECADAMSGNYSGMANFSLTAESLAGDHGRYVEAVYYTDRATHVWTFGRRGLGKIVAIAPAELRCAEFTLDSDADVGEFCALTFQRAMRNCQPKQMRVIDVMDSLGGAW